MPDAPSIPADVKAPDAPAVPKLGLRATWPLPVLALAGTLLTAGLVTAYITRPRPDVAAMLAKAQAAAQAEDYDAALKYLNEKVAPYADAGLMSKTQTREFHLLRGRSVALAAQRLHVDDPENAKQVVEELLAAEETGGELESRDMILLGDAFVSVGKPQRAREIVERLPEQERLGRSHIVRRIVQQSLDDAHSDPGPTLRLIAEFLTSRDLSPEDRAWSLGRQGELLLKQGLPESAVNKLLQTMPSIVHDVPPEQVADLRRVLGKAYFELGDHAEAARQLESAAREFSDSDPRWGAIQSLLGRIDELSGDPSRARKRFEEAITRAGEEDARLPPMLGLAEVLSTLGEFDESLKVYADLIKFVNAGHRAEGVDAALVSRSLLARYNARMAAGDTAEAKEFADLAVLAVGKGPVPGEALIALANANRRAADEMLQPTRQGPDRLVALARLDPATREQARIALVTAGKGYKQHADSLGALDNDAYADSLWMAADSYDLAGDQDQAIPLLNDFLRFFPADRRASEASFRLAQAYFSRGDYPTAAEHFRELLRPVTDETGRTTASSAFANRAIVPLAQCLLLDGDPANDAEAEELLTAVVNGRAGSSAGKDFRDALVELAGIRQRSKQWAAAIPYLVQAIETAPDMPGNDAVRYALAESYRKEAAEILATVKEAMPQSQRERFLRTREEHLARAAEAYTQVIQALGAKDDRTLSRLERLQLRNAYFNYAECAFAQRQFEEAIRRYTVARERYNTDPASLVALIQIVNAYVEMGDRERAGTAQIRARQFYDSLPDTAWSDPDLPMSRQEWQRWLDSTEYLGVSKPKTRPTSATSSASAGEEKQR